ncbi:hypothetical protein TNCV_1644661 [Trichonephila clavipes]|nr:hypothetical protein TNCV_1644661 [Trichonephila clavipes]
MQLAFKNRYGKEAPTNKSILRWYHQFKKTACLCKKKSSSWLSVSDEAVKRRDAKKCMERTVYVCRGNKSSGVTKNIVPTPPLQSQVSGPQGGFYKG